MRLKHIAVLSALYVAVYVSALLWWGGVVMQAFETGAPASKLQDVLSGVVVVLGLPLLPLVPTQWFPGATSYLPLFVNGMIWATILLGIVRLTKGRALCLGL